MSSPPPRHILQCSSPLPKGKNARSKASKIDHLKSTLNRVGFHGIKRAHELPPENMHTPVNFFDKAATTLTKSNLNTTKNEFEAQFPRKTLSEISGLTSAGRTSLALRALAQATSSSEWAAWIEIGNSFDPQSAATIGINLSQILWIRAPNPQKALIATECVLEAGNFRSIFVDLAPRLPGVNDPKGGPSLINSPSIWSRLRMKTVQSSSAVIILSETRISGSFADFTFHLTDSQPIFDETPTFFSGLKGRIAILRHKLHPNQCHISWESKLGQVKAHIG